MPYIVHRETFEVSEITKTKRLKTIRKLVNFDAFPDTEFTEIDTMTVDCVGIYSPAIEANYAVVFTYDELSDDFNPIISYLQQFTRKPIEALSERDIETLLEDLTEVSAWVQDCEASASEIKNLYTEALNDGYFDDFLANWKLDRSCLKYSRKNKSSNVEIAPERIVVQLKFFFQFADLFKIWGQKWQYLLLKSYLIQFKTLRFMRTPPSFYAYFNGKLYEFIIELREVMYRFPPRNKSLKGQATTFGLNQAKMDIASIASKMLHIAKSDVYQNMTYIRENLLEEFLRYNAIDLFTTSELDSTQQKFLQIIEESFNLEHGEIKDTTGANVAGFIKKCLYAHYGDKNAEFINNQLKLTQIDNLQEIPLNNYGIQPFMTVGGLLYTRMSHHPFIKGKFGDLDQSSCYATLMSSMNVYLGEPVVLTFKYKRYKPTLKKILEFVQNKKIANDAWFVRVSGELSEAINTLILSDLRFTPKKVTKPTKWDVKKTKQLIANFNRDKTSKKLAVSTLLTKEVKFGLINADLWECIKLLPPSWVDEYLNLQCEVLAYHPPELIGDTVESVQKIAKKLPEESYSEEFDARNGLNTIVRQYHKGNATLRFPISEYWEQLRSKRGEYKKAKNPVQEVYKLFSNSGYGVLACLYLATNNLMASNYITAGARANAWMMVNALNGFGAITDGTGFDWEGIPLRQTFHSVLAKNASYLTHFDTSLKSGLKQTEFNQTWIDESFKPHLSNFYQVPTDHYLVTRFKYELKEETFTTKKGLKWIESKDAEKIKNELSDKWDDYLLENGHTVKTTLFTRYANTNAGNYAKGIDGFVLIDKTEYDFESQEGFVKARSFPGYDEALIEYFVSSLEDKYDMPFANVETKIIKFGDGNALAIKFLNDGVERLAHPMGFSTLAFKIMKLISRSQFLFATERSLKNFETNEEALANISKELLLKSYWDKLPVKQLETLGAEIIPGIDYYAFSKSHPVGIGFELLALAPRAKGNLKATRIAIDEKVQSGCENFNAGLHLNRNFKHAEKFRNLFASIIIQKANAEYRLKQRLINASTEPTILTLTPNHLSTIQQIWVETSDEA